MGAMIFAFFMLLLLIFGGIIFAIYFKINNKRIKFILKLIIILIMGLPVSWIVWLIYGNIMTIIENILPNIFNDIKIFICLYFIIVNILGVLCYTIYKKYIKKIMTSINIKEYLFFLLHLNILCDIFPIILLLTE